MTVTEPQLDSDDYDTGMFDSGMFGEDYLYFYESIIGDTRSDADVELIWRLLNLSRHGGAGSALRARPYRQPAGGQVVRVTGVDVAPTFRDRARHDAVERGVAVDYRHGDMRALPWAEYFDIVVNWFTSFGYFGDKDNMLVLREIAKVLRPGGRMIMEMGHLVWQMANFKPTIVIERDRDYLRLFAVFSGLLSVRSCRRVWGW
jgi:SAM-dependent methyltransferase